MADNAQSEAVVTGGLIFATDEVIGGPTGDAHWPFAKLAWGALNTATLVNTGASAVPIQDGGNSITIDAPAATPVAVQLGDGTNQVGIIATGPSLNVNLRTINGATPSTNTGTVGAGVQRVTLATDVALPAGTNNIGDVDVLTVPAPLSTTGGGLEAAALRVTLASDSTGVLSVDDNGGSLTVDGTVAVSSISGTTNVNISGVAVNIPVTGIQAIDGVWADDALPIVSRASTATPTAVSADGDNQAIWLDRNGRVQVGDGGLTLSVDDGASSLTVDGTVAATQSGTWILGANSGVDIGDVTINNAAGASAVNIQDGGNSITVDGTVTANLAAGTNNIGDVDVLTLPSIPAGTNNIGDVDVLSGPTGASALQVQGTVAADGAAANNPVLVGASSETMADSAPANRVSADADATRISATDGAIYTIPTGPQIWSYHSNGSTALTDATVHAAPGAGLSLYVQSIVVSTGAATALNVFFEEGASTVLGPFYLEAVAGRGLCLNFLCPKKITANTALTVTTSAAIAHSVDVTGFIAPG